MSNVFFSGFYNYIVKASNPYEGRFYESNGTLIYELKKICLEWDVIGQVRFPEHQCVQIVFKYAQINKIINNEIICCLLNHLNCDEDAFGWFYLKDGYLYSKTVLLPDNENYSIENVMNIINFYLGYTINLYDLFTGIEKELIRMMGHK